jgi:nitrogen regulatory protein P-II 1
MKQIIAVVRPHLAEHVLEILKRAPLEAITVSEVKGYGRQKSYLDEYKQTEFAEAFLPKVEIVMWVDDTRYEETLEKLLTAARSGRIGDGKVFTLPVESHQ